MRLWLIRHGQTEWNLTRRAQGQTDIPLDERGHEQARCLAEFLKEFPIRRVISSDLSRASQTAVPIARSLGLKLELEPRIRERKYGDWEGFNHHEFNKRTPPGTDPTTFRPPGGGESLQDLWDRILPFSDEIRYLTYNTAIISHGTTAAILLAQLIEGTVASSRAFGFQNASICRLKRRPGGLFRIQSFNEVGHLSELSDE